MVRCGRTVLRSRGTLKEAPVPGHERSGGGERALLRGDDQDRVRAGVEVPKRPGSGASSFSSVI